MTFEQLALTDRTSLRENEKAYDRFKIRPRILRDVATVDTSTTILGTKVSPSSTTRTFK